MSFSPTPIKNQNNQPITDPSRLLPPRKKQTGPTIGIIIILLVLIFGAVYALSARFAKGKASADQAPYILAGTTTLPDINE
jgi:hypothetical protein